MSRPRSTGSLPLDRGILPGAVLSLARASHRHTQLLPGWLPPNQPPGAPRAKSNTTYRPTRGLAPAPARPPGCSLWRRPAGLRSPAGCSLAARLRSRLEPAGGTAPGTAGLAELTFDPPPSAVGQPALLARGRADRKSVV